VDRVGIWVLHDCPVLEYSFDITARVDKNAKCGKKKEDTTYRQLERRRR